LDLRAGRVVAYLLDPDLLGWHYLLTAWFIRCAFFWPLVAELIWLMRQTIWEK